MKTPIACGQFAPKLRDRDANISAMRRMTAEAAGKGAALIVFPEMCLTGYLPAAEAPAHAVGADGEEMRALGITARELGICLCLGFGEKAGDGRFYNSMAFINAAGTLKTVYRKVHLFGSEGSWAAAGSGYAGFDAAGMRCGIWICYDTRFPEAARALALDGVTCGLTGAAWLGPPEEWELAVRARAMDNGIFVAAAAEQGGDCRGVSLIADPHGRILARGKPGRRQVILAEHDPEAVLTFRARLPLLEHRRPEAYGRP